MSEIISKWRELSQDPLSINFKELKIKEIISYPAAGNDVIECICLINNEERNVFIKIERSKFAAFEKEIRHTNILRNNKLYNKIPNLIEDGLINDKRFIVLDKVNGLKLPTIFKDEEVNKKEYLIKYGYELSLIHQLPNKLFSEATQRKINDYPKEINYPDIPNELKETINYLIKNRPIFNNNTFIHGDFHYANILWEKQEIVCVLDFEYSGKGFKEQDIAWACLLRSTQYFMDNIDDITYFLEGYLMKGDFNFESFRWCLINCYCHFFLMNLTNEEYKTKLIKLIKEVSDYNFINIKKERQ